VTRRFATRMARRELRASGRRLTLFIMSVSVGVAAIVAVGGFKSNVLASLQNQGRLLLGADLELESRFDFPSDVSALLDSLESAGADVARVTSLPTMVSSGSGRSALLTMGAVAPSYPFYGSVETDPAGLWETLGEPGSVLADAAAITRLSAQIGDTLAIGEARLVLRGQVDQIPGDPGIRSAVNPRIYISRADLDLTGLVREGSIVSYRAYVRSESRRDVGRFLRTHREALGRSSITWDTAAERERDLERVFDALSRFLGLVGLGALLLGGVGVASAMHLYVRQRRGSAAVLRCLGASGWTLVRIYVLQAFVLGLAGALLGAAFGVALQAMIPSLLADVLPLDLEFALDPGAVAVGVFAGLWTSVVFAWRAILPVRHVPALGAVHQAAIGAKAGGRNAGGRIPERAAISAIGGTIVGLCVWQAGDVGVGLGFAAGAGFTLGALALVARLLVGVTRHAAPKRSPFPFRQGVANLFRPQNQTRAAVVSLGFAREHGRFRRPARPDPRGHRASGGRRTTGARCHPDHPGATRGDQGTSRGRHPRGDRTAARAVAATARPGGPCCGSRFDLFRPSSGVGVAPGVPKHGARYVGGGRAPRLGGVVGPGPVPPASCACRWRRKSLVH